MRARILVMGAAIIAALVGVYPVSASSMKFNPPKQYYLSLGDSVAFGYQRDAVNSEIAGGTYTAADFPGYTYRFGAAMQAVDPGLRVVDFGCPGETTVSFTTDCAFQTAVTALGYTALHSPYVGMSQEEAALAFLHAHRGGVGPITISLGVNDLFGACPSQTRACVAAELPVVGTNMGRILAELRAAASPNTEIIVLLYYNPLYVVATSTDALAAALDGVLATASAANGARTADTFAVINSTGAPGGSEAANVCLFTLMCPTGDIHPSDAGYAAIAGVFWTASGYAKLGT